MCIFLTIFDFRSALSNGRSFSGVTEGAGVKMGRMIPSINQMDRSINQSLNHIYQSDTPCFGCTVTGFVGTFTSRTACQQCLKLSWFLVWLWMISFWCFWCMDDNKILNMQLSFCFVSQVHMLWPAHVEDWNLRSLFIQQFPTGNFDKQSSPLLQVVPLTTDIGRNQVCSAIMVLLSLAVDENWIT